MRYSLPTMPYLLRNLPRHLVALALLCVAALPVSAQRDTQQLRDFRNESEAFNRHDPFANAFRAGHYNGYVAGVLDTLQGRSVCFKDCVCEIDKIVGQYLEDHPKLQERPAIEWLVPLLQSRYPCK